MKSFMLEVEYIRPINSSTFKRMLGPIYGKKAYNTLFLSLIKKRNVVAVKGGAMGSFDDYLDDRDYYFNDQYGQSQDENEKAVEVFEDYRVPDERIPDKLV